MPIKQHVLHGIEERSVAFNIYLELSYLFAARCVCTNVWGAFAGGVWADQLIHWRRYRHHWLTLPLLALVTAVLAILGLVPLMNNFAHIAGFVAGFLACSVALLNRRVSFLCVSLCFTLRS